MYEQCNKKCLGNNLFNSTLIFTLGILLWLGPGYILDDKQNAIFADVTTQKPPSLGYNESLLPPPLAFDNKNFLENKTVLTNLPDFTYAAKVTTPAVVHIKASQSPKVLKQESTSPLEQFFKEFFGEGLVIPREYQRPPQEASGSGVIYKSNGYIITNNHVIEGADQIEVTLNDNRSYKAKLIGGDPVTDLALLKIEASNLPTLVIGSSDKLEVGEWVLAVGNPFNLYSTVTKGIVSAKSRHLGSPGSGKLGIQSFIQTDAVINPGNSGGALVNLYGELVGINTAIYASRSASFIGYGFAIPASLVKKVADDFIQYGSVQRVLLGVSIQDLDAKLATKLGLKIATGVYIHSVQDDSACVKLLQKEDVITEVNGRKIRKSADLQEVIGCSKPGDKIVITLYRKGKEKLVNVLLEKEPDAIQILQTQDTLKVEGAIFQNIDAKTKANLKVPGGVLVQEVGKGKFQTAGLKKGYVLVRFDKQAVANIAELADMIRRVTEPVLIQVMEPNKGSVSYLAVEFGKNSLARQKE